MRKTWHNISLWCGMSMMIMSLSLVGCGNQKAQQEEVAQVVLEVDEEGIGKPSQIKLAVDSSFPSEAQGRNDIIAKFKELTGIELVIIDLDMKDEMPEVDVAMIGHKYYGLYAQQGLLTDITAIWENSALKASGRIPEGVVEALYQEGQLYGFPVNESNGNVTYIRKDWLDKLGLDVPKNYDDYIKVLEAFTYQDPDGNGKDDTYGVTASGIMDDSAPYIQCLPEFWQDAYPYFYQAEDGTWLDGFTEESTYKALERLRAAYANKIIDQEVISNILSVCRDKFYASKVGVITDTAGTWSKTLDENLKLLAPDAELIAIEPIAEVESYRRTPSSVLAITGDCKNPEGVFKYFIAAILDGKELQQLFTYGVEGIHYEKTDTGYKMLQDATNEVLQYEYMLIDPTRVVATWTCEDPFAATRDERILNSKEILLNHSRIWPDCKSNEVLAEHEVEINDCKQRILCDMILGEITVDEGMKQYKEQVGELVEEVLQALKA